MSELEEGCHLHNGNCADGYDGLEWNMANVNKLRRFRDFIEKKRIIEARPIYGIIVGLGSIWLGYICFVSMPLMFALMPNWMRTLILMCFSPIVFLAQFGMMLATIAVIVFCGVLSWLLRQKA